MESLKSPELIGKGIEGITVVVPSLDETTNILTLRNNFRLQRKNLSPNINLRLVISDNGSGEDTLEAYKQILQEEVSQNNESKLDIDIIYGSNKGFNSSARSEGIKDAVRTFHERNLKMSPQNHLILNFDADTVFERENALQTLVQNTFADSNTMVAFGPIKFISSTGKLFSDYERLQRPFTRILLAYLFRLNGKHMQNYINPPYEIFHCIFTAMRESALVEPDNPNNIIVNFKPTDRAGVDIRMSLLLQRRVQESQVVFDKRLTALTSARGYETKRGDVSRLKFIQKTLRLFFGTHYVPYALQRELDTLPEEQKLVIAKNIRFVDVIGDFANDVEREVYGLGEDESVSAIISKSESQKRQLNGFINVPARNLKTGEIIPNHFVTINHKIK